MYFDKTADFSEKASFKSKISLEFLIVVNPSLFLAKLMTISVSSLKMIWMISFPILKMKQ